MTAPTLPSGDVTFLFVTAEVETGFSEAHPEEYRSLLSQYDSDLRSAVAANGGVVFEGVGDAVYAVFADARRAAAAALDAQRRIISDAAVAGGRLRARIGIHTGYAQPQGDHYIGAPLYRCARIMAVAHGSQILLSATTAARAAEELPPAATLQNLGTHRLKDLAEPEQIFQLRHPELPSEFPPLKSLSVLLNNLPSQLTTFVGRDEEIAEISRLLRRSRLVTLLGPGGVGKTRLSIQVAADLIDVFPDGVWLVELAALVDPALVTQQVASALGIREEPSRPLIETLLSSVGSRHLLLLLDNCEHLLDACASLVARLLASSPQIRVLATSREKLGHADEALWSVPPLRVPDPTEAASALRRYESVRLFADRAASVQSTFAITDRNAAAIAQICHQLDGIPLAIELAAARVNVLTIDQLAGRIQDRFHLLTRGSRVALPRQQTLRAVIDWSYDLLEGSEKTLFNRLAVFLGGWTIDAARPVCAWDRLHEDDMEDTLRRLSEKSLTVEERAGGVLRRYRMLETLRQYASERLSESGEAENTQAQHASFFMRLGESAEPELTGPRQQAWLATLDTEHDNLRAALRWAETAAQGGDVGCRLGGALWRYWSVRGLFSEGRERLSAILAVTPQQTPARAKALHGAGVLATQTGDYGAARGLYEESLAIRRELGDRAGVANTLSNLGIVSRWLGEVAPARKLYEESLALRRDLGDKWGIATSLNLLGLLVHYEGDPAQARALLEESLHIRRELGDRWTIANSLNNLGLVLLDQGDYSGARALYRESLGIARELGDKWAIAFLLEAFAGLGAAQGEAGRALRLAGAAEALRETIGSPLSPADRATLERKLEPARRALPAHEQAQWTSGGRSMTVAEASDYALGG